MKERQIRDMVAAVEGLTLVRITSDGKHHKGVVRTPDGVERMVSFPKTESDHRALLNKRAQLRAMSKQYK